METFSPSSVPPSKGSTRRPEDKTHPSLFLRRVFNCHADCPRVASSFMFLANTFLKTNPRKKGVASFFPSRTFLKTPNTIQYPLHPPPPDCQRRSITFAGVRDGCPDPCARGARRDSRLGCLERAGVSWAKIGCHVKGSSQVPAGGFPFFFWFIVSFGALFPFWDGFERKPNGQPHDFGGALRKETPICMSSCCGAFPFNHVENCLEDVTSGDPEGNLAASSPAHDAVAPDRSSRYLPGAKSSGKVRSKWFRWVPVFSSHFRRFPLRLGIWAALQAPQMCVVLSLPIFADFRHHSPCAMVNPRD